MAITPPSIKELQDLMKPEVITAGIGGGTGLFFGEFTGEWVKTYLGWIGYQGMAVKALTKGLLAVGLGAIAVMRGFVSLRPYLLWTSIGSFFSIFVDLIAWVMAQLGFAGGATIAGQTSALSFKGVAKGAKQLGKQGNLKNFQGKTTGDSIASYSNQGIVTRPPPGSGGVTPYTGSGGKVIDKTGTQ